jgi:nitrite reductase (NO-forming)
MKELQMTRRSVLVPGGIAGLALPLLGAVASACGESAHADRESQAAASVTSTPAAAAVSGLQRLPLPQVAPRVAGREATVVQVELETREVPALIDDTVGFTFFTFGGTVPSPMIRVRQDDVVELTLHNHPENRTAHNIDLHAVTGPGGGAKATVVNPSQSATIRFKVLKPGVSVNHCAVPPIPMDISSGMYGLIVVEPPVGLPPDDHEFSVMQGDFYPTGQRGQPGVWGFSRVNLLGHDGKWTVRSYCDGQVAAALQQGADVLVELDQNSKACFPKLVKAEPLPAGPVGPSAPCVTGLSADR